MPSLAFRQILGFFLGGFIFLVHFQSPSSLSATANEILPGIRDSTDRSKNFETAIGHLREPLLRDDLRRSAAPNCAAAACHGGSPPGVADPSSARGAEYPLWLEQDPHARSWRTLCGDQSLIILRNLKILQGETLVDRPGFENCLACHNTSRHLSDTREPRNLTEGVGCASCHGPDELWINSHYSAWGANHRKHLASGFVPLKDPLTRARACAACHIGDVDRDMNHDLIAAGHPPLFYEFASYHAQLPKHWREIDDGDGLDFEARQWFVGQIAALDASLALLERRSDPEHSTDASPWPEFSEFTCAACHHSLAPAAGGFGEFAPTADNLAHAALRAIPATATPSPWYRLGMFWILADQAKEADGRVEHHALQEALSRLQNDMNMSLRAPRERIYESARSARHALSRWASVAEPAGSRNFDAQRLRRIVAGTAAERDRSLTWEEASQWYLAGIAARGTWPGGAWVRARAFRELLLFPSGWSGPGYFPAREDGYHVPEARLRRQLLDFQDGLRGELLIHSH